MDKINLPVIGMQAGGAAAVVLARLLTCAPYMKSWTCCR